MCKNLVGCNASKARDNVSAVNLMFFYSENMLTWMVSYMN